MVETEEAEPERIQPSLRLAYQDSNLDRQNQNLQCYHYTISQYL